MKKILIVTTLLLLTVSLLQAQSFKYAVICDTRSDMNKSGVDGVNVSAVKAICQQIRQQDALFVLAPGDLICGNIILDSLKSPASDTQFQTFLTAASSQGVGLPDTDSEIILYPVRGNHESYHNTMTEDEVKAAWFKNIGYALPKNGPDGEIGFTYSFVHENALFLGVDEYMQAGPKEQKDIVVNQDWIDEELKEYPDANHLFVFGHTPAFAAHHLDCLAEDTTKRNAFMNSIYKRSQVYFCGHDHFFARASVPVYGSDGKSITGYIQQVITPSGAPFLSADGDKWDGAYTNEDVIPETYIDNVMGYQLVSVEDDKVTVKYIATEDGCTFSKDDQGEYNYTYNDNWETWNFAVMDQFSFSRGCSKSEK